ncbi:MAG: AAA family ATPase [Patescibacteria group bacterium]
MKSLQLDKPHAIITIGIQGSGKTFFAQKFAETFSAPFIEQSLFVEKSRDNESAESLMRNVLAETLKTGRSIVVELSLADRTERTDLNALLRKAGYVPLFVWVQTDTDTAMSRSYKTNGVSQDDFQSNLKKFSAPLKTEPVLVISGKHTFATQAKVVLKKLSAPRTPAVQSPVERKQPIRGQIIVR